MRGAELRILRVMQRTLMVPIDRSCLSMKVSFETEKTTDQSSLDSWQSNPLRSSPRPRRRAVLDEQTHFGAPWGALLDEQTHFGATPVGPVPDISTFEAIRLLRLLGGRAPKSRHSKPFDCCDYWGVGPKISTFEAIRLLR